MFERFTASILRRPGLAASLLAIVIGLFVAGLAFFGVDFSVRSFFGRSDPETVYLDTYDEYWGTKGTVMIVADGGDEGLLTRTRLQLVSDMADHLGEIEGVGKVISVTSMPWINRTAGMWIPVPMMAKAPNDVADDSPEMKKFQRDILADPRLVPSYLSEDGRYGVILVTLDVDGDDLRVVRPVVGEIKDVVEEMAPEGITFHVAGIPAIRADVLNVVVGDQLLFVPIASVLIVGLLYLLFRSRHGVLIPALAAGVPVVMLLGLMGWTGENFGLLNQIYLVLVPSIAVADAIHLVSRYHEELDHASRNPDEGARDGAIIRAMGVMGVACFLTSFTTCVGFLSLLQTKMPVLRNFGVYAAIGVAFAYFTVLFIVPLALRFTRLDSPRPNVDEMGFLSRLLDWCANAAIKHAWPIIIVSLVLAAGAVYAGQFVKVNTRITNTFDDKHPTTIANNIVDQHLGGVVTLEIDLKGEPGVFSKPEVLAALDRVEQDAQGQDAVRSTFGPASALRSTSVLLGGPDAVPTDPNTIGRLLKVGADADELKAMFRNDEGRARIFIRSQDVGAIDYLAFAEQVDEDLEAQLQGLGIDHHVTGSTFVAYRGLARVTRDLRNSLLMAFLVIGAIIAFLFRDLRTGVLSVLPNALPLVLGYGLMAVFGWTLEPAPAVVFTIAIGISVDSAIHVLARFKEELALGLTRGEAVHSAIMHSGRAIGITCIILIMGFGVQILSSSPANASFGKLGTMIITLSLFTNLLVLPAMLQLGMAGGDKAPKA